jgi:hypothetical protein
MSVVSLSDKTENNRMWSLEQMLEQALADLRAGKLKANQAVLLYVDTENGRFRNGHMSVNITCSDSIKLCEVHKMDCYMAMGR